MALTEQKTLTMDKPLVTIVVVSYNQGKFIKENLDSIKAQTYPNIELIIADDASPDNSVEVFESWLKDNQYTAKKNYHVKNTGLATVLNECIEKASGKYIKLIAADDFLHPTAIEKCIDKLEELGEEYGMVFTNTFCINEGSVIIEDIDDYDKYGNCKPQIFRKELIKANRIAALTVTMRLDVLKETGLYDSKYIVEDYYRWLKINEIYLITYIQEKLAYYRQHDSNISKTKKERIQNEDITLKIMFDKKGDAKEIINLSIFKKYRENQKFTSELISFYKSYPFKIKRLSFAIKNKIPFSIYKFFNKV